MTIATWATEFCAGFSIVTLLLHFASIGAVALRCQKRPHHLSPPADAPPVTLLRPLRGIDNFARETLGSSFRLDYPDYEIIFCLEDEDDPVAPIVRGLIATHPHIPARLLIGRERASPNPKLNNVIKGWEAARHDWILMADSNVLMPGDYIQRMSARWQARTGLVCSMPIGSKPANFSAEFECAFLNTFQARWQYFAEILGFGFAQGKSMFFRRDIVERGGGIRTLGKEMAEDAATTKLVRAQGLSIRLVDNPFEQPLGRRGLAEIWSRQLRWARLRRITFPAFFIPELLVGCVFPTLAGAYAASGLELNVPAVVAAMLAAWFGAELGLARCAGWHGGWRLLVALMLRDLALPVLWAQAWIGNDFNWRGNDMTIQSKLDIDQPVAAGE